MISTLENHPRVMTSADHDPFELDITFIEQGATAAALLNVTDDGCGSTCPNACGTSFEG